MRGEPVDVAAPCTGAQIRRRVRAALSSGASLKVVHRRTAPTFGRLPFRLACVSIPSKRTLERHVHNWSIDTDAHRRAFASLRSYPPVAGHLRR